MRRGLRRLRGRRRWKFMCIELNLSAANSHSQTRERAPQTRPAPRLSRMTKADPGVDPSTSPPKPGFGSLADGQKRKMSSANLPRSHRAAHPGMPGGFVNTCARQLSDAFAGVGPRCFRPEHPDGGALLLIWRSIRIARRARESTCDGKALGRPPSFLRAGPISRRRSLSPQRFRGGL
jgi:hypothetical protein